MLPRNTNAQCGRSLVRYTLVTGDSASELKGLDFFGCDSDPACAIEAEQRLAYWSAPL